MLRQVPPHQVPRLVRRQLQQHVHFRDVARVEPDRVPDLGRGVPVGQELVGRRRRPRELGRAREAEEQEVEHEAVVLHDERGELEPSDDAVGVRVGHVLVGDDDVVLGLLGSERVFFFLKKKKEKKEGKK